MENEAKKRPSGRSRSKPPAVVVDDGVVGEAEAAVQALLSELRGLPRWTAVDEVLGASAVSLARALDGGPLMSRGAVARELRSTVEKLPRPASPGSRLDELQERHRLRREEMSQRWAADQNGDN